jgi:hypothetical protein
MNRTCEKEPNPLHDQWYLMTSVSVARTGKIR